LPGSASAAIIFHVWRRVEPVLDRQTLDGIIRMLMSINENTWRLVEELLEDDGEEKTDT
jgi:hypothetical protein